MIHRNQTILFQGDSITDAGRNREDQRNHSVMALGGGYAKIAAAQLLSERPADGLTVLNRGISGNRVVDLYARIRVDTIHLKPDVLSVLIGVNDAWHGFRSDNGVPVAKYERVYRDYLRETREELPSVRFVLCEPFVLRCGHVAEEWVRDIDERRAVVRGLAAEFGAVLVPFQEMFDEATRLAPPEYWAPDGVHPSAPGHHRMARAWLAAVAEA